MKMTKQSLCEEKGQVLELLSYQVFLHVMTSNDFLDNINLFMQQTL